jgi:UDP-N-acetylmuramyl pentapeptide phosphotransferase/UDP-N-acetylglucosamine-1-phosphate transferase
MVMLTLSLSCLVTFSLSILCIYFLRGSLTTHLLDVPNERSLHSQPTPRGGGLGFILVFIPAAVWGQFSLRYLTTVFSNLTWLALIPLVLIGVMDDWKDLSAKLRYLVQLSVSSLIVWQYGSFYHPWMTSLGGIDHFVATATTILGLTALINFYNFMDGMDGLLAGVSTVQFGFMAIWSDEPILWLLVSALVGFLYWNWSPAKIFMGDVGSTFLGAVMAIALLNQTGTTEHIWSALAITLPITGDAIYTLFYRLVRRENIFKAHRSHIYQRLHQSGWSHTQVAAVYIGITLGMAVLIYLYQSLGAWLCLIGVAIAIFCTEQYLLLQAQDLSLKGD